MTLRPLVPLTSLVGLLVLASPLRASPASADMIGFQADARVDQLALESRFDAGLKASDLDAWLMRMTSAPNNVGSPHDRANAQWQLAQFKAWGWDAHIETFDVLYPTPIAEGLELTAPRRFKASLHEPALAGDRTSGTAGQLPPYVAYQGDGDVRAPIVYANYGMPDDYTTLARLGVDVRGKIVIARYGGGWRGLKPKLAQQHGAVGCIIYSDPADDGYAVDDVYPKGPERPASGVQRGSVQDITTYPGDPLTPGVGSTPGAARLTRAAATTLMKIPTLPISYADARPLLAALDGPVAPAKWRGALPITYHVGAGAARAHLWVRSDWSTKPIYDVIATMRGVERPDEWIVRGNHHDGWVFGASDPLSGQVALMAEAKAIGALARTGWRPARTLIYASWDAEEPGLIGSTEWAETHAAELQKHAIVYINSDNIDRGFLHLGGSPAFQRLATQVARDVVDPETGGSLAERLRARLQVAGWEGGGEAQTRLAKQATPGADLPIEALGSGSDYSAFLQHLGIATLDVGFSGEGEDDGVYHSAYDSYDHYRRFGDPGEAYGVALARTVGRLVLRTSQAGIPPMRFSSVSQAFERYEDELKVLARTRRERVDTLNALVDTHAFSLAADPQRTSIAPSREGAVPTVDFAPLDRALVVLAASATAYDAVLATRDQARVASHDPRLDSLLIGMEQRLLSLRGLPDRAWYRNLAYAPGVFTGYGAKTFPGIREAIEADHTAIAGEYLQMTADAIGDYAKGLDAATVVLSGR